MPTPEKLFKYCAINANSLRSILRAQIHHSSPVLFNDPLDCQPTLEADVPLDLLRDLHQAMLGLAGYSDVEQRMELERLSTLGLDSEDGPRRDFDAKYISIFSDEIRALLNVEFGKMGVLSLSEHWNEPLMWSHYAHQHQGMCVEYSTSGYAVKNLKKVNYNAPRSIRANDLYQWKIHGDSAAQKRVFDTYFYAKAPQWNYEREWRDVSDHAGTASSRFDLSAISFGLRTDPVWKWLIVKALHLDKDVELYEVFADDRDFTLHRRSVDREEIEQRKIDQPAFRLFGLTGDGHLEQLAQMAAGLTPNTGRARF